MLLRQTTCVGTFYVTTSACVAELRRVTSVVTPSLKTPVAGSGVRALLLDVTAPFSRLVTIMPPTLVLVEVKGGQRAISV